MRFNGNIFFDGASEDKQIQQRMCECLQEALSPADYQKLREDFHKQNDGKKEERLPFWKYVFEHVQVTYTADET